MQQTTNILMSAILCAGYWGYPNYLFGINKEGKVALADNGMGL